MFNITEREVFNSIQNDKIDFGEGLFDIDAITQFSVILSKSSAGSMVWSINYVRFAQCLNVVLSNQ